MAKWEYAVITEKGLLLQNKVATGGTMAFTKVKTGSGSVEPVLLIQQTDVTGMMQEFGFTNNPTKKTGGEATLYAVIDNEGLNKGYNCYQLGVYATDPDDGEILYAILQAKNPLEVPSSQELVGWSAEFNIALKYGNATNITVNIDAAGRMTEAMAEARFMKLVSYNGELWQFGQDENGIFLWDGND
jgi:hypothetical protein